jgi:hypothetical protein
VVSSVKVLDLITTTQWDFKVKIPLAIHWHPCLLIYQTKAMLEY